ncbi:MAG: nitrate- and nitrite sensing domain-containing protein, partial [Pseudomonadota bacterium]
MLNVIDRLTMRQQLTLMLVVPLIAIIWFAQIDIKQAFETRSDSAATLSLAELSVSMSAMVHELQKERGMSAGYLGSKGMKFTTELPAQHALSTQMIDAFTARLAVFDRTPFGEGLSQALDAGLNRLEEVSGTRKQVLDQQVPVGTAVSFYSELNQVFLGLTNQLPKLSASSRVSNQAAAYNAFLQSKERAGIERAVLAAAFAADRFARGGADKFRGLVTQQDTFLTTFRALANQEALNFYTKAMSEPAVASAHKLRQIALDRADRGGFNVDPTRWFSIQTEKMGFLKGVENYLAESLIATASGIYADASGRATGSSIAALLVALGTTGFAFAVMFILMRQLGTDPANLQKLVKAVANGNLDYRLNDEHRAKGVFTDVVRMRTSLKERIETDKESLAVNLRIRSALNRAGTSICIVDNDLNVLFVNRALETLLERRQGSLRSALSGFGPSDRFNSADLKGKEVCRLHTNPAEFRRQILSTESQLKLTSEIADLTFR